MKEDMKVFELIKAFSACRFSCGSDVSKRHIGSVSEIRSLGGCASGLLGDHISVHLLANARHCIELGNQLGCPQKSKKIKKVKMRK